MRVGTELVFKTHRFSQGQRESLACEKFPFTGCDVDNRDIFGEDFGNKAVVNTQTNFYSS